MFTKKMIVYKKSYVTVPPWSWLVSNNYMPQSVVLNNTSYFLTICSLFLLPLMLQQL